MKKGIILALMSLLAASNPLWAIVDIFSEIGPSDKAEGFHAKIKLEPKGEEKILLTLPNLPEKVPASLAWLVVCKEERSDGNRNFRYQVNWFSGKATSADIQIVAPIKFGKDGIANLELTRDLASRSYIVYGGHYRDGAFATLNLPAFLRALNEDK